MVTGDLLSAAGLLVSVVGILYGVWYPEIKAACDIAPKRYRADRDPQISSLTSALWSRAVPLAVAMGILVALLAQPAVRVVVGAVRHPGSGPYDPIRACFVAVWLVGLLLLSLICREATRLFLQRRRFSQNVAL